MNGSAKHSSLMSNTLTIKAVKSFKVQSLGKHSSSLREQMCRKKVVLQLCQIYNGFCITCFGLQNPFWVLQHSMGTIEFWLVGMLTAVLAVLPRFVSVQLKRVFYTGNTKGGSITVLLTPCLTGLETAV